MADHVKDNSWGLIFKGADPLLPGVPMGGSNANGLLQCATKIKRLGPLQATGTGYIDFSSYASDLHTLSNATAGDTKALSVVVSHPQGVRPVLEPESGWIEHLERVHDQLAALVDFRN